MLKKVLAAAAVAGALAVAAAAPAAAAGQFCYDVQVVVNGESQVSQAACQPIG